MKHIYLVEVKYCEDIRPKNQLEASKQQHRNLCRNLSRASAHAILHTILLGMGRVVFTPHTLKTLLLFNLLAPDALLRTPLSNSSPRSGKGHC
eukprot:256337-Pelagomonas_calceolata.AAC.1